jgi:hypothetical protein
MAIILHVEPNTPPMTWQKFCEKKGPFSIALDGYVKEGPITSDTSPRLNFNHHEGVDRLTTRATCAQVLMLIKNGVMKVFRNKKGEICMDIYVNDCDQDVCTSVFLLRHGFMTRYAVNSRLHRLVDMVDRLDSTAGAYPFYTDWPVLQKLNWVFAPYTQFRKSGQINNRVSLQFESIINKVGERIMEHIKGKGGSLQLDMRYQRIGGGKNWVMVREIGSQAYIGMARDGITAFVSVRERRGNRWNYTISRSLPIIPFDVPKIIAYLNDFEGCTTTDCWGGGNTIGGSPRINGSELPPKEIERIINKLLNGK